jgi:hypothetical protein
LDLKNAVEPFAETPLQVFYAVTAKPFYVDPHQMHIPDDVEHLFPLFFKVVVAFCC